MTTQHILYSDEGGGPVLLCDAVGNPAYRRVFQRNYVNHVARTVVDFPQVKPGTA